MKKTKHPSKPEARLDPLSPTQRSELMSHVKAKNTRPELWVRKKVHALGYRYRLHRRDLPGRPDMVFPSRMKVIFVHGCFWHRHPKCPNNRLPKTRLDFWKPKLDKNRRRDRKNIRELQALGWDVLVLWECEIKDERTIMNKVTTFLEEC